MIYKLQVLKSIFLFLIVTNLSAQVGINGNIITSNTYTVNTFYAELGGYVIEVNSDGTHGLVVAMQDQGIANFIDAKDLVKNPDNFDINGAKFFDWHVPNLRELEKIKSLYFTGPPVAAGFPNNFQTGIPYWSSKSQNMLTDFSMAAVCMSITGNQSSCQKTELNAVRAVRSF